VSHDPWRARNAPRDARIAAGLDAAAWADAYWSQLRQEVVRKVLIDLRGAESYEALLQARALLLALDAIDAELERRIRAGEREREKRGGV